MRARPRTLVSRLVIGLAIVLGLVVPNLAIPAPAHAATLPAGFSDSAVLSGLTNPTVVRFSPDGRVFVAEKSGLIWVFDSLADTTPILFADMRTNVHNYWDRGLLGMTLAPNFPTDPSVYALYTYDAAIGNAAPRWGVAGATSDGCPSPPGAGTDGCGTISVSCTPLKPHPSAAQATRVDHEREA
jgi:Glucose / Sorbosone dehydrogenase